MKRLALALALACCAAKCAVERPAAYGTELELCVEDSSSAAQYETCCIDVAHRYGRDPSFCLIIENNDGGRP